MGHSLFQIWMTFKKDISFECMIVWLSSLNISLKSVIKLFSQLNFIVFFKSTGWSEI
ncbi:hypothetical protein THZG08_170110 [Vibrio owensii]|nr:hypothetical protein THZG08_170110 [Vibrio owensii]